jgi:hypothetical protein
MAMYNSEGEIGDGGDSLNGLSEACLTHDGTCPYGLS